MLGINKTTRDSPISACRGHPCSGFAWEPQQQSRRSRRSAADPSFRLAIALPAVHLPLPRSRSTTDFPVFCCRRGAPVTSLVSYRTVLISCTCCYFAFSNLHNWKIGTTVSLRSSTPTFLTRSLIHFALRMLKRSANCVLISGPHAIAEYG